MATTGHETEAINVQGLKASLQKFKTNNVDPKVDKTTKVNNHALSGDVTITKGDIGLGNVVNTGDSATPVSGGTTKFTTGGAYTELAKKADTEGYYKDLHVGVADNLYGETQTNDVFTFRPTAGIQDIASGDAPYGGGTIKKVEGNGVSWNQLFDTVHIQATISSSWTNMPETEFYMVSGHKYFVRLSNWNNISRVRLRTPFISNELSTNGIIVATESGQSSFQYLSQSGEYNVDTYANLFDLTLLGIDSLTTVEQVEQWLADNVGAKEYYEYNPGELIPVKDYSIKSVGFNLWDEQWELGTLAVETGEPISSSVRIRSKNFCKLIQGEELSLYNKTGSWIYIFYYDISKKLISSTSGYNPNIGHVAITPPENAVYFKFTYYNSNNVVSYDGGTCLSIHYSGDRDGEYEEHWEHTMPVDITKLTGKLNGTGEDVVVFPDGMKKAGTVCDEIVRSGDKVKAIKRIYSLKLTNDIEYSGGETGTDEWGGTNTVGFYFYTANNNLPACASVNSIKSNFAYTHLYTAYNADVECVSNTLQYNYIAIRVLKSRLIPYGFDNSSASSNINAFKAFIADNDIEFFYAIEPQEYILDDEVLPIQYRVDDYGIEEVLLNNEEGVTSCSPKMTLNYGLNAAKTIGDLPHEYISIHKQAIDEGHQAQARHNINAASQDSIIRIQEQLDAINPKVDNDVYVDLGLPSGLLWAKRNIDVTQPDGFASSEYTYDASYFSWGNVEGHNPISTTAFDYDFSAENYATTPGSKLTGNIGLSYDAARANLGAPWRMPTKEDYQELFENCDFVDASGNIIPASTTNKLITINSVGGIRLKSKVNGKIVFFPSIGYGNGNGTAYINKAGAGYYWSSTMYSTSNSVGLVYHGAAVSENSTASKNYGFAIRPVM